MTVDRRCSTNYIIIFRAPPSGHTGLLPATPMGGSDISLVEGNHSLELDTISPIDSHQPRTHALTDVSPSPKYRLYRRRFAGLVGLVRFFVHSSTPRLTFRSSDCLGYCYRHALAVVWPHREQWYVNFPFMSSKISSPSSVVAEFGFTLDQVNWLGNVVSCIYLPTALVIPTICSRYGIRRCVCAPQLVRSFC